MKKVILIFLSFILVGCTVIDVDNTQGNADAQYELAYSYQEDGNMRLAKKYYKLASEQGHREAQNNLGNIYFREGKYDLAEKYFRLSSEQGNDVALCNLGIIYNNRGEYDIAKKYFETSANLGNPKAQANLGIIYEREGKYDLAEKWYKLAISENFTEAEKLLKDLYKKQGKYKVESPSKVCKGSARNEMEYINEVVFPTLGLLDYLLRNNEYKGFSSFQSEMIEYKGAIKHILKKHSNELSNEQINLFQELYLIIDEKLNTMKQLKELM